MTHDTFSRIGVIVSATKNSTFLKDNRYNDRQGFNDCDVEEF